MELKRFALALMGHFLSSLLYVLQKLHLIEAAVDSSSILEHREEIRELWEKRMMADENQSSPSSTVVEKGSSKTPPEEGSEEAVAIISNGHESETKVDHKLTNGHVVKSEEEREDSNANHIQEKAEVVIESQSQPKKEVETELTTRSKDVESEEKPRQNEQKIPETTPQIVVETTQLVDIDNENNNAPDSLEVNINTVVAEHVVETTYTSETSLVMKQVEAEEVITTKEETIVVKEEVAAAEVKVTAADTVDSASASIKEQAVNTAPAADKEEAHELVQVEQEVVISTSSSVEEKRQQEEETRVVEAFDKQMRSLEIDNNATEDDGDGYVRVAECLPHVEGAEDIEDPAEETEVFTHDEKPAMSNGHEPLGVVTPEPFEKPASPEIEQFVKSGGLKRILPGVQKTEQPYSTCTTETKIAMEIREMREREEELRIMREQALLSPVVSPVPPKSPRSDSPCLVPKEITTAASTNGSPVPPGCGYRVSSVFGHKGNTSPSPPVQFGGGEEKVFKGFSKESTVEKEIRLARDREEELRAQQGLPPREDDSYVKPSQVKSSQVRVFGKPVGAISVKQAATAKIQLEIEEQTQRELALRETGSIQTLSSERTDAKVAKLKTPDTPPALNGNPHPITNGSYTNGNDRSSPDVVPHKRGTPSPTGHRPASIFSQTNGTKSNGISMHKFIASKGKETTFSAPPKNGTPFSPREFNGGARVTTVPPNMVKLKRTVSVESKIQQEIMDMKQREEELKMLQLTRSNSNMMNEDDITENEMNHKNNKMEYDNGIHDEELSPQHNKLIAQWEQRIQKAES